MTLIQRGDTSEGLRRRWQVVNADSAPAELGDAIQPVMVVENDRPEFLALQNQRRCSWSGTYGDFGVGVTSFCSLFNPPESGVLAIVDFILVNNITAAAVTSQPILGITVDGVSGGAEQTNPTPHFWDTRVQGLPACQIRVDSAIVSPVNFILERIANHGAIGNNKTFTWPGGPASRHRCIVLAPNTRLFVNHSTDGEGNFAQSTWSWVERPMGTLEAQLDRGQAGTTGGRWTL